ncbi:amino acid adenylation domain-containing protein [Streptomyces sp. DSM 44915]|uniref:Amino acid adenylation domain-containing protein n=1 Tax=Streptomyces chisholmiae TaxID=3075540 RepID=A0ABU2JPF8_9ACTN|nr:non-ribosomal peptide synthetase [Streptomyces sp. DSM 44915]MDT0266093.1 amino acid adenylation domain-containing protein [Streptomyces sp. DSM 44915]
MTQTPAPPQVAPLSYGQERLLWLHELNPADISYHLPLVLHFHRGLAPDTLETALAALIRRHPGLGTRYVRTGSGETVPSPAPDFTVPLEWATETPDRGWRDHLAEVSAPPFDLLRRPGIRARAVRRADGGTVLLLITHHIAADGGSLRILAEDLTALCTTAPDGATHLPVDTSRPYPDFARREREALDPATLGARLAYWRERLAGAEPVRLPGGPDGGEASDGVEHEFRLSAETTTALRRLALRQRAPLTAVLGAAFQVWLARHTGQRDITIGVGLDRRPARDFARTVGFFVENTALRATVTATASFRDLVGGAGRDLRAAVEQAVPFRQIVAEVRHTGAGDLVNAFFVHHGTRPSLVWTSENGEATRLWTPSGGARFDIELNTLVCDGELRGGIRFRAGVLDPGAREAFVARFARLLRAAVDDPATPVTALPLSTPEEDAARLAVGVGRRPPAAAHRLVVDVLGDQVTRSPDLPALVCGGRRLTFGELGGRVARLARLLTARGVGPESLVGVLAEEPETQITALLAILTAGGVFVPLDVQHPPARTAATVRNAGVGLLLTGPEDAARSLPGDVPRIALGDPGTEAELAALPADWPDDSDRAAPLRPSHAAYVIHTSGSTGEPKGVCVEHRQLSALLADLGQRLYAPLPGSGRRPRVAMTAAVSFDVSWQGLLALVSGCEVHAASTEIRRDVIAYADYLRSHRVDLMDVTPTHLALLVDAGLIDAPEEAPRVITVAGEALPRQLWDALAASEATTAHNYYGPTEATVYATAAPVAAGREPAIGGPLGGTDVYVLDERLRPVPPGVRGEIFLAGDQIARGYLHRPRLTAERFVPCPFGPPGSRMYRTGDQGRWDAAGRLVFEGRGDGQVKLRGFRIELGEIEAVLTRHPAVARAAVLVVDGRAGPQLAACLTTRAEVDSASLREYATRHLPSYMVPVTYLRLADLPRNTSGKLDQRALRALAEAAATGPRARGGARPAAAAGREETLCRIVAEVLGTDGVGPDDSFFALGGHSLLVPRLQARVRAELGTDAAFRDFFDCPTPRELAARLAEHGARKPPLVPTVPGARPPLSPAQQRLWFIARSDGPSPTYNIPVATRLTGPLDVPALRAALRHLVEHHPTLRTVHPDADGVPYQRILSPADGAPFFELRETAAAELSDAVTEAAAHPFDPTTETPLRVTLFRTGPEEHVLLLLLHHIAADGWSVRPLLRDLGTCYQAAVAGAAPRLPFLPLSYTDYAYWQRSWLGDPADPRSTWSDSRAVWKRALDGMPVELALPYDRPRPEEPGGATAGVVDFVLPADLHERLAALAVERQAGLTVVLQAGVGALLYQCGAGEDVPLGGVVSGRADEALEDLVGFFVNTLVLRLDLSGQPSFRQLLDRTRETALAAYDHQDLPFEGVVEAVNPPRSLHRHPLFQTLVVLQPGGSPRLPGLHAEPYQVAGGGAKFDLAFTFRERRDADGRRGDLHGRLEYQRDLFDHATAERLVAGVRRLLTQGVDAPDVPLRAEPPVAGLRAAPLVPAPPRITARAASRPAAGAPAPEPGAAPGSGGSPTPRTEAMCGLFAELLGADQVAASDDFFALGGHSLLIPRLLARVRSVLGADLAVRDVFRSPTPAGLAARLTEATDRRPDLTRHRRPARPPLSPAQQRLWFLTRLPGQRAAYNIPFVTSLRGPLDTTALRRACGDLAARHEPLRAVVGEHRGVPYQRVLGGAAAEPPYAERETTPDELERALREAAAHPFDPATETPLRVTLFRTGPEEHVLLLLLHHIAADGWSMEVLARDLATAYRARSAGDAPRWAPLPATYTDYAVWQHALLGTPAEPTERAVRQRAFWGETLAGLPAETALPHDRPRPRRPSGRAGAVDFAVPAETHRALTALATERYAGLTMVLQAGVGALLYQCGAGEDVPLGGVVSGRADEALEDLVGFFVNTLVLRLDLSGQPSFRQLLDRTRDTALAAYDHQDLPFEGVVEAVNPPRAVGRHPLFQAMVLLRPDARTCVRLPGLVCAPGATDTAAAKFDLTFSFAERLDAAGAPAGLGGQLEYSTDLFDEPTVRGLADALVGLLAEVCHAPDRPLAPGRSAALASSRVTASTPPPAEPGAPWAPGPDDGAGTDPAALRMSGLFTELLGPRADGVGRDFFAAGGNSLLAVRLLSAVRAEFGRDLTVSDVFERPTPAGLAARLADRQDTAAGPRRPPLRPGAAAGRAPVLAPVQQGLWFIQQLTGGGAAYNVPLALRLPGPLDEEALRRALDDVRIRHDALRLRYAEEDGLPAPRLVPPASLPDPLPVRAAREADLPDLLRAEAGHGFDLQAELPIRALLLRLDSGEHLLSLVVHHLSMDAWSLGLLRRDLATAYLSRLAGSAPDWPPAPPGYGDYAVWHQELLGTPEAPTPFARSQEEFWRATLAGLPAELPLPLDRPRPRTGELTESSVSVHWGPDVLARLDALAAAARTSRLTLAEALVATLLSQVTGAHDIPLGTPVTGRTDQALFEVVGHLVNTVVVRVDTAGQPSLRALTARVRDAALAAYDHQDLPFDRLVTALRPARRTNRNPLFQTLVTWPGTDPGPGTSPGPAPQEADPAAPGSVSGSGSGSGRADGPSRDGAAVAAALRSARPEPTPLGAAKCDLTFEFTLVGGDPAAAPGLRCRIGYADQLFHRETALALSERLGTLLERSVTEPDRPLPEIDPGAPQ